MKKSRLPYIPALDGLRALAVSAVLLYHAEVGWMRGGFIGVEIFFVISGYLITALLLAEWERRGTINLLAFWMRRARRLLPALVLLIVTTLTFAVIFLPGEVAGLRNDALAALGFAMNWYLVLIHRPYFETVGRPPPLQHVWSLAVEEQFYLLWPVWLLVCMQLWGRRGVLVSALLGAAVSATLLADWYRPGVDPSRLYYGTDTRATGLLIGAALACVWLPGRTLIGRNRTGAWLFDLAGCVALGELLWIASQLHESQPALYRGALLLVALLSAALIAVVVHPYTMLGRYLLAWQPLRWIGERSYGIYLWHWPVFVVTRPRLDLPFDGPVILVVRLAATLLLAELSYRYVEIPVRAGALRREWRIWQHADGAQWLRHSLAWSVIAGAVSLLCLIVSFARPPGPPPYLAVSSVRLIAPPLPTRTMTPTLTPTRTPLPSVTPSIILPTTAPMPLSSATLPAVVFTATPEPRGPVTAIGDSVMLGAVNALAQTIGNIDIDAEINRQVGTGIEILRARRDAGQLGKIVVFHMGTNGTFSPEQFDELMGVLANVPKVILLTIKAPRVWEETNNVVITEKAQHYPNVVLIDWRAASIDHPEIFWDDQIHLRPEGAQVYADLIAVAINTPDPPQAGSSTNNRK